jgi:hypothetical protein
MVQHVMKIMRKMTRTMTTMLMTSAHAEGESRSATAATIPVAGGARIDVRQQRSTTRARGGRTEKEPERGIEMPRRVAKMKMRARTRMNQTAEATMRVKPQPRKIPVMQSESLHQQHDLLWMVMKMRKMMQQTRSLLMNPRKMTKVACVLD